MASYLVQAGTALYHMTAGGVAVAIALPAGVTLFGAGTPCRPVVFGSGSRNQPSIIVANGGTQDFFIDYTGLARRLQIVAPVASPIVSAGAGATLTGTFAVACSFKIKDANGATVIESGIGPISAGFAAVAKTLRLDNIPVSGDGTVNCRGIYRTLNGGNTLYPWFDIDNNTTLSEDRGVLDAVLSLLPTTATRNGSPPDLKLITTWRDRLWAVPRLKPDYVRWTDDRNFYGWSADNELVAPPQKTDAYGVTAFIPRRDALGVARRRQVYMVVGNSNDSFQRIGVSESLGCVSQESVIVINNVAYMLGEKSVNEWSDNGVVSVSDMQVAAWFNSDTYFNRAMFPFAQGRYNDDTEAYELTVALAGSTAVDHWVSYHRKTRTWFGPHKIDADAGFVPVCCGNTSAMRGSLSDASTLQIAAFGGSDGYVYRRDTTTTTDAGRAVSMSVGLPPLSVSEPDLMKFFGQPTIHTRAETQGVLTVTPTVGNLTDTPQADMNHDLTFDRETLPRLGAGRYCQLTLSHSATTERPRIYGIEIPYAILGRR